MSRQDTPMGKVRLEYVSWYFWGLKVLTDREMGIVRRSRERQD
jgi:hypothetical protein